MARGWYAVHTYSGYEQKIERLVRRMMEADSDFAKVCLDVKVPFETLIETKDGVRKESKHKVLPGYILIELDLPEDETWKNYTTQIKKIQGVTGFLTATRAARPLPLSRDEMDNILRKTGEIRAEKVFKPKQNFELGETVSITDGPFSGFTGVIEEINLERNRIKVVVEIFGRPTPVEIEFGQAEKI
ncbi:MAG: transcription termination/antitermination protein NusG [Sphaerochaetaceae bacterium]|nr:transcription termination/antitermination protein NusG [Sphaerochaetaceae bacterium]